MKKILLAIACLLLSLCLAGCDSFSIEKTAPLPNGAGENNYLANNVSLPVYNSDNEKIGELEHLGFVHLTNDSMVYSKLSEESTASIPVMDYYKYSISAKETIKLGTVNGLSQQSCESVLLENHLYLLVLTGNVNNEASRTLKLLDLDLNNNSMSEVFSEKGGFPYDSITVAGNRLLIHKASTNVSYIEAYDPKTGKTERLKYFDFDDKSTIGEAIRKTASDESTISLLMLVKETADSVKLRVDVYDYDMNLLRSVDVSDISPEPNELRQGVSNFEFSNNFLYYENFSMTRCLGKIEENGLKRILDTDDDLFTMAADATGNNRTKLFYHLFSDDNSIYLLDLESGKVSRASFYTDDKRYYIINMARDANDNILVQMGYKAPDTGEELPDRAYYLKLSDLHFEECQLPA